MTDLSDRLFNQLYRARARNLRAKMKHIGADAITDTPVSPRLTDAGQVDRFVRERVEGALCWRDPSATNPDIQARARA